MIFKDKKQYIIFCLESSLLSPSLNFACGAEKLLFRFINRDDIKLYLSSNMAVEDYKECSNKLGLHLFFDSVILAKSLGQLYTDIKYWQNLLLKTNLIKKNTTVVTSNKQVAESALVAGVKNIWFITEQGFNQFKHKNITLFPNLERLIEKTDLSLEFA